MAYVKRLTIHKTLLKALQYITNPKKTNEKVLVSSNNCSKNEKVAIEEMRTLKKYYNKEDGIQGFHFIQSFKKDELSEEEAHQIGKEWTSKFLDDNYQFILSTHTDRDHIHNHIVINSVGLDGRKYNSCINEREDIRHYSDLVCLEHGLSIIEPKGKIKCRSYKEWLESQNKTSWKDTIREDIDFVISYSDSFEDFKQKMKDEGYYIKQGENIKYMTLQKSEMKKPVRGKTLGEDYTEECIKNRIKYREFNIRKLKSKDIKYRCKKTVWEIELSKMIYKSQLGINISLVTILLKVIFKNNQNSDIRNKRPVKYTFAQKEAIKGIKDLSSQLNLINKYNFKTRSDVKNAIHNLNEKIEVEENAYVKLNNLQIKSAAVVTEIEMYYKYKKYQEEYQHSILKGAYKKKYEYELGKFETSSNRLKKFGLKTETEYETFKKENSSISEKIKAVDENKEKIYKELFDIENLQKYLDKDKRSSFVNEITLEKNEENKIDKER